MDRKKYFEYEINKGKQLLQRPTDSLKPGKNMKKKQKKKLSQHPTDSPKLKNAKNTKQQKKYKIQILLGKGAELHNVNVFTQTQIWVQNLPQKRVNRD